jgi:hypothetical protein
VAVVKSLLCDSIALHYDSHSCVIRGDDGRLPVWVAEVEHKPSPLLVATITHLMGFRLGSHTCLSIYRSRCLLGTIHRVEVEAGVGGFWQER